MECGYNLLLFEFKKEMAIGPRTCLILSVPQHHWEDIQNVLSAGVGVEGGRKEEVRGGGEVNFSSYSFVPFNFLHCINKIQK